MKINHFAISVLVLVLAGCTWVEPTKESSNVTLVKSYNVKTCLKLGAIKATVKHKVGVITRNPVVVTEELVTVAKNRAAEMGADSIVSQGELQEGTMSFDLYRCSD